MDVPPAPSEAGRELCSTATLMNCSSRREAIASLAGTLRVLCLLASDPTKLHLQRCDCSGLLLPRLLSYHMRQMSHAAEPHCAARTLHIPPSCPNNFQATLKPKLSETCKHCLFSIIVEPALYTVQPIQYMRSGPQPKWALSQHSPEEWVLGSAPLPAPCTALSAARSPSQHCGPRPSPTPGPGCAEGRLHAAPPPQAVGAGESSSGEHGRALSLHRLVVVHAALIGVGVVAAEGLQGVGDRLGGLWRV